MSKFELQDKALEASGVSVEESEEAAKLQPSLFERLGEDGFEQLSTLFYNRVFQDKDATWFLNIFSSSTKIEAIENQVRSPTCTFSTGCIEFRASIGLRKLIDSFCWMFLFHSTGSLYKPLEDPTCTGRSPRAVTTREHCLFVVSLIVSLFEGKRRENTQDWWDDMRITTLEAVPPIGG
jgi:hypothetical protein